MNFYEIIGYPLFAVSALEILPGIALLRRNPRNSPVNRSAAAFSFFAAGFSFVTALMYILASRGMDITLLARAKWIGWLMLPAGAQFIFFVSDENSRAARIAGSLLYPFWLVVLCVSLSTGLIERGPYTLAPYLDRPGPLGNPLRTLGVLQVLWVLYELFRLRLQAGGIKKAQLSSFLYGMLVFTGGGALLAGILPVIGASALVPGLGAYFGLPWVVLAYYAVTHRRRLDPHLMSSRAISIVLLTILFTAIHIGLSTLFEPALGHVFAILLSLTLIFALVFGTTLNLKLQKWIMRIMTGRKYDYQNVLRESIKAITTILPLDELLEFIMASVRKTLDVESACLFLKTADGSFRLRQGFTPRERTALNTPLDENLTRWMKVRGKIVLEEELETQHPGEEARFLTASLRELGAAVIVPLFSKSELRGVLALGRKKDGEPYNPVDVGLLEALAGETAVAIENAKLYEEMEEKVRERTRALEDATKDR